MLSVRLLFTIESTYIRDYGFFVWLFIRLILPHKLFSRLRYGFWAILVFYFIKISSCWFFFGFPFIFCNLPPRWIYHEFVGVRMDRFHSNGLKWYICFVVCKVAQTLLNRNRYGVREKKTVKTVWNVWLRVEQSIAQIFQRHTGCAV